MVKYIKAIIRIMVGLFLYALGIVLTIQADMGLSPWDILNDGASKVTGLTFGQANIIVAVIILAIDIALGQKVGIATILNVFMIGTFIDIINYLNFLPLVSKTLSQLMFLLAGIVVINLAMYFYIGAGYGAGPRDGLMIGISKKFSFPVAYTRIVIEVIVAVIGFLLGGKLGAGTVILAVFAGIIMKYMYKQMKFDLNGVAHTYIARST